MDEIKNLELPRLYKTEEYFDIQICDTVNEIVSEYYGIDDYEELSEETLNELYSVIEKFRDEHLHEYSVLQSGFSNLLGYIEGLAYDKSQ